MALRINGIEITDLRFGNTQPIKVYSQGVEVWPLLPEDNDDGDGDDNETISIVKVVFVGRFSSPTNYDQAAIDMLEETGKVQVKTWVNISNAETVDYSDVNCVIVGAPNTSYISAGALTFLTEIDVNIISMCRHYSRNQLDLAASSASTTSSFLIVRDGSNENLYIEKSTDTQLDFTSSFSMQRISSLRQHTDFIAGIGNSTINLGIGVRKVDEKFWVHWAGFRMDLAGPEVKKAFRSAVINISSSISVLPPLGVTVNNNNEPFISEISRVYPATGLVIENDKQAFINEESKVYPVINLSLEEA